MWSSVFYCFAIHTYRCFVLWNRVYLHSLCGSALWFLNFGVSLVLDIVPVILVFKLCQYYEDWKYIDQLLKIRDQYSKEHALETITLGEMMLIMRKKPKEYKDLNRIYRAIQRCESEIKE